MKWPWQKEVLPVEQKQVASLESVLRQVAMMFDTVSGITVNAENCMQSPTVHAIVTAVQNRLSISPIKVMRKSMNSAGREIKEELPDHPVAKLLRNPNSWQTTDEYIGDAASSLVRHGTFFAAKLRGQTGPIQRLEPIPSGNVEVQQDRATRLVTFRVNGTEVLTGGRGGRMHYARLGSRDYYQGNSPVHDVRESIGLEIAAERFGASFFGNGALPLIYFQLMEGFADFQTDEEKLNFLQGIKGAFGGDKKFSTMMLPQGMELNSLAVENDKAQFIETRRFIRTVIAGAFGVPPHLVGDLERATFNNVEQQDTDFVINVILPIARRLEAAMERDLLTDQDRNSGVCIRFNLDSVQRADIKTRNESLKLAREWGVINGNEWREQLGMNPLTEDEGGEEYIRPMNMQAPGENLEVENEENPTV